MLVNKMAQRFEVHSALVEAQPTLDCVVKTALAARESKAAQISASVTCRFLLGIWSIRY